MRFLIMNLALCLTSAPLEGQPLLLILLTRRS